MCGECRNVVLMQLDGVDGGSQDQSYLGVKRKNVTRWLLTRYVVHIMYRCYVNTYDTDFSLCKLVSIVQKKEQIRFCFIMNI